MEFTRFCLRFDLLPDWQKIMSPDSYPFPERMEFSRRGSWVVPLLLCSVHLGNREPGLVLAMVLFFF
jgi:hypothetical protein